VAITRETPNTIWLGGGQSKAHLAIVNDLPCDGAITPGMLIHRQDGTYLVCPVDVYSSTYALNQPELNKGVDDAYVDGDLMMAGIGYQGDSFYTYLASGQNVGDGDELQSAGSGKLKALGSGRCVARALEAKNATAGDARIRVEVSA
jgi:hypothetical protein